MCRQNRQVVNGRQRESSCGINAFCAIGDFVAQLDFPIEVFCWRKGPATLAVFTQGAIGDAEVAYIDAVTINIDIASCQLVQADAVGAIFLAFSKLSCHAHQLRGVVHCNQGELVLSECLQTIAVIHQVVDVNDAVEVSIGSKGPGAIAIVG